MFNRKMSKYEKKSSKNNDLLNICILISLYILQGIPLGLTGSLPFILSSKNVSYRDQGTFSFAFWPFTLKILWAPIVDSVYKRSIGKRKSWLIPMQYLIGIFMLSSADYVNTLLNNFKSPQTYSHSDIYLLTLIFFMFTLLAATQDIAVDGWCLTLLSK
jgi:MFS transporter, PAT family, solute carrier family 33 (acetyl-CoA transportor), member 1